MQEVDLAETELRAIALLPHQEQMLQSRGRVLRDHPRVMPTSNGQMVGFGFKDVILDDPWELPFAKLPEPTAPFIPDTPMPEPRKVNQQAKVKARKANKAARRARKTA